MPGQGPVPYLWLRIRCAPLLGEGPVPLSMVEHQVCSTARTRISALIYGLASGVLHCKDKDQCPYLWFSIRCAPLQGQGPVPLSMVEHQVCSTARTRTSPLIYGLASGVLHYKDKDQRPLSMVKHQVCSTARTRTSTLIYGLASGVLHCKD